MTIARVVKSISPIFGLDIGKRQDSSAIVLANRIEYADQGPVNYATPFIHRWDLGTPYPEIAKNVREIVTEPFIDRAAVSLVIDVTGVGEGVADMVCDGLDVPAHRVWICGGKAWRFDDDNGSYNVPKGVLVSTVRKVFGERRLDIVKEMKLAPMLKSEIDGFQVTVSKSANELYDAREGQHDDILLALAIALWAGESICLGGWDVAANESARLEMDRMPATPWEQKSKRYGYDEFGKPEW